MSSHSSSSDDERPDEHLLDTHRPRGGWSPSKKKKRASLKGKAKDEQQPPELRRRGGFFRTKWFLYGAALLAGILIVTLSLVFTQTKHKDRGPQDGLSPPWYPTPQGGTLELWNQSYVKASKMVRNMSLVEKVNITTGTGWGTNLCVGNTGSASDVGFPMLCLQDGPLGIRFADNSTLWPAAITAAATWNKDLIYKRGKALGKEHRRKGVNILLGPSMGPMGRMPAGGRNWEGFGPDPVLSGIAAAETIRGIQEEGVMATAKHYIANEQEHFRQEGGEWGIPHALSSDVDDRTLHEIYLWPFQDSVKVGVASIMCSYNMVNSSYACQNSKLQNGILKDELGFQGFIQSDWLAQRSGVASALAGLDMSMPGDGQDWEDKNPFWGEKLTEAVLNGSVPMLRLDDMATRIVASWYQLGQDNEKVWPKPPDGQDARPNFSSFSDTKMGKLHDTAEDDTMALVNQFINVQVDKDGKDDHRKLALRVAREGHVLVKNEGGILPIAKNGLSNGDKPKKDSKVRVGIFGEDAGPAADKGDKAWPNQCEDRACNEGTLAVGWGSGAAEFPFLVTPNEALEPEFDTGVVNLSQSLSNNLTELPSDLESFNLCLVFVNSDAGEGFHEWDDFNDRRNLYAQKGGDDLVKGVADTCPNTVVVFHAVGPVVVERWIEHPNVKALILANLPGEESGSALRDVLFGHVDASGRLPYTIGRKLDDYGEGGQIMTKPKPKNHPQQVFKEGLLIDYRHFDNHSIAPRYEFGYGLSYTTWELSDLTLTEIAPKSPLPSLRTVPIITPPSYTTIIPDKITAYLPEGFRRLGKYIYPYLLADQQITTGDYPYPKGYSNPQQPSPAGGGEGGNPSLWDEHLEVNVTVTNTGSRKGQQVVQVYLSFPKGVIDESTGQQIDFPVRVLRGFEKVEVGKGESEVVSVVLTRRDVSYWSVGRGNWVMPTTGQFTVGVGISSRDLRGEGRW